MYDAVTGIIAGIFFPIGVATLAAFVWLIAKK